MSNANIVRVAAVLGLAGVALGAFGAHALKEMLESRDRLDTWHTGVDYQIVHAVALLALGLSGKRQMGTFWCWLVGVILFSGSIYGLCLLENARWLGPVTPLGGLLLMVGWLALVIRPPRKSE